MRDRDTRQLNTDQLGQYLEEIGRYDLLTADDEVRLAQAMEAAAEARISLEENPSHPDRGALERVIREGVAARENFVQSNLRLVVANARRYAGGKVSMSDLIQEGNLGLITAVEKYDWRKGFKFSTYATWWVRQAMQRALSNLGDDIRIPTGLFDIIPTVLRADEALRPRLGRTPTPEEIAAETGLEVTDVERALSVPTSVALQTPVGEDGATLGEFIADEEAVDPSEEVQALIVAETVRDELERLPEAARTAIELRFGITGEAPATVASIARIIGRPEHQVRQLIAETMETLAAALAHVDGMQAA